MRSSMPSKQVVEMPPYIVFRRAPLHSNLLSEAEKLEDNEETTARKTVENQRGTRRMEIMTKRRTTVDWTFLEVVSWTTSTHVTLGDFVRKTILIKGVVVVVKINIFNLCFEGFLSIWTE